MNNSYSDKFKHLLSPYKLGNVSLKNRFVFLPHGTLYGNDFGYLEDGLCSERLTKHYIERAKGGSALVCIAEVAAPGGQMAGTLINAYDLRNKEIMEDMVEEIHSYGCRVFDQLTHGGHTTVMRMPQLLHAPTQMPEPSLFHNTKELEEDELKMILDYFVLSAVRQKEWGFDGVEIKIAHDGLLRTFLNPYLNRRKDKYGGSYENFVRYPLEIISAIRKEVGPDYPIGIRLCLDEFTEWGYSLDYGLKLAKTFEQAGVTYISSDAGTIGSLYMQIQPNYIPLGFAVYMSATLKKTIDIPVIAFGRINDPIQAETILSEGNADLIGMCRQLLSDPETPNKTIEGRLDDIRHCVGCMEGCVGGLFYGTPVTCIQNPACGREKYLGIGTLKPAAEVKKIMVIGAGIGGLKSAEICAKRGHKVTLYEKTNKVGGQLLLAEKIPYRAEIEEIYRYVKKQLQGLEVPIIMNCKVDFGIVEKENPDCVIVATGSNPCPVNFEGINSTKIKIFDSRQAILDLDKLGDNILFIDDIGYWQGVGVADLIQTLGCNLTIVTSRLQIGVEIEGASIFMLYRRFYKAGVNIITSHIVKEIQKTDVVLENIFNHNQKIIKNIDTIVVAQSSYSDNLLYKKLKESRDCVYAVGDCVAPRAVQQIILEAEELSRKI
jgi:2,4-dienoyl-CoA reductase-like NADH-dependent reductase (Old Yellow Enzyme family)